MSNYIYLYIYYERSATYSICLYIICIHVNIYIYESEQQLYNIYIHICIHIFSRCSLSCNRINKDSGGVGGNVNVNLGMLTYNQLLLRFKCNVLVEIVDTHVYNLKTRKWTTSTVINAKCNLQPSISDEKDKNQGRGQMLDSIGPWCSMPFIVWGDTQWPWPCG